MKFALNFLKSLEDSGEEVCIFSREVSSLLFNLSNKDFPNFSSRSYYFWRKFQRPLPLSVVFFVAQKFNLNEIDIEYFSVKGGNKVRFPNKEDILFCYFLGIILGDGCLVHSIRGNRNSWYIQITSNSLDKINFLKRLIKNLFDVDSVFYDLGNYYNLHVFSKPLVMILANKYELPVGLKYDKIKVPEIAKSKNSWKIAFVKGVFECDGNIYDYRGGKSVQLRQKSRNFLFEIKQICEGLGIFFRDPYYDKANNSWVLWSCKKEVVDNFIKKISCFDIRLP